MNTKLSLKMQPKISLGVVMNSKLLRLATVELEQVVWSELADNPALELAREVESPNRKHSDYRVEAGLAAANMTAGYDRVGVAHKAFAHDLDRMVEQVRIIPSVTDRLLAQVRLMVDGPDLDLAMNLLQFLDGHGYLRLSAEALAAALNISTASVDHGVEILHQLDPPGIGARDERECLLIQCKHLEETGIDCGIVRRILTEVWDDFTHQRWLRMAKTLRLPVTAIEEARSFIVQNFYPYPLQLIDAGAENGETLTQADLIIVRNSSGSRIFYTLEIPQAQTLEMRVSPHFDRASKAGTNLGSGLAAADLAWIKAQLDRAHLFIAALNQRWATLRRIGQYLLDCQAEFIEAGPRYLKPLTRAKVAADLGFHESTVSRAINEKTVQLPGGQLILLSDFFDNSLATREAIRQLLVHSNKTLTDHEIARHLQAEGLNLARRTITKYRQQLNIPASYQR